MARKPVGTFLCPSCRRAVSTYRPKGLSAVRFVKHKTKPDETGQRVDCGVRFQVFDPDKLAPAPEEATQ